MPKKKHNEQEKVKIQTNEVAGKLMEAVNKDFDHVMILGMKEDGSMEVSSTIDNTIPMHYILNRAVFELNIFEMQNKKRLDEAKAQINETEAETEGAAE